ncbi:MAG: DUF6519 domain-containing protein [Spirochaetia bacterium]
MADISRNIFNPQKHYTSVRMQQGKVILDDDWNENERIKGKIRQDTFSDIIGACGTADNGFRVSLASGTFTKGPVNFILNKPNFFIRQGSY